MVRCSSSYNELDSLSDMNHNPHNYRTLSTVAGVEIPLQAGTLRADLLAHGGCYERCASLWCASCVAWYLNFHFKTPKTCRLNHYKRKPE